MGKSLCQRLANEWYMALPRVAELVCIQRHDQTAFFATILPIQAGCLRVLQFIQIFRAPLGRAAQAEFVGAIHYQQADRTGVAGLEG